MKALLIPILKQREAKDARKRLVTLVKRPRFDVVASSLDAGDASPKRRIASIQHPEEMCLGRIQQQHLKVTHQTKNPGAMYFLRRLQVVNRNYGSR